MHYLAILGQNRELSLAELVAVYPGLKNISRQNESVVFDSEKQIDISKLGGTPKLAEVLIENIVLEDAKDAILEELKKLNKEQKIFFGLSFYENRDVKKYDRLGKEIKSSLKNAGYKVRWAVSRELALSSVYIKTNKLLTRGFDFNIVFLGGGKVTVAKTIAVQDFADYEFRDMRRPARDLLSGMTPPKLAKLLINLSGAGETFLDPFCGSGTFLAEAALLGIKKICGSDVSEKAVSDSQKNLSWLKENYNFAQTAEIKLCDIKNISTCWPASRTDETKPSLRSGSVAPETSAGRPQKFSSIATEPYLGSPIRGNLSFIQADKMQKELSGLYEIYLKNLSSILEKNGTLVLIVPFFFSDTKNFKINLRIKENGLTAVCPSFLYSRPDQKVGREIYILKKI